MIHGVELEFRLYPGYGLGVIEEIAGEQAMEVVEFGAAEDGAERVTFWHEDDPDDTEELPRDYAEAIAHLIRRINDHAEIRGGHLYIEEGKVDKGKAVVREIVGANPLTGE